MMQTRFISQPYVERYKNDEWRATIFRDMVVDDARQIGERLTYLDIGCGKGFDGDEELQRSIAETSSQYIGVEPDPDIAIGQYVTTVHRATLEGAPIDAESIDVAFAIMVLEHLPEPQAFFDKLHQILKPGGVFWALTVDGRHPFCRASIWAQKLKLKEIYLNNLMGERGTERYENYPVFYRCNTPEQVGGFASRFASCDYVNFARVGQLNSYYPKILQPLATVVDRGLRRGERLGSLLAIRVVK